MEDAGMEIRPLGSFDTLDTQKLQFILDGANLREMAWLGLHQSIDLFKEGGMDEETFTFMLHTGEKYSMAMKNRLQDTCMKHTTP